MDSAFAILDSLVRTATILVLVQMVALDMESATMAIACVCLDLEVMIVRKWSRSFLAQATAQDTESAALDGAAAILDTLESTVLRRLLA